LSFLFFNKNIFRLSVGAIKHLTIELFLFGDLRDLQVEIEFIKLLQGMSSFICMILSVALSMAAKSSLNY